jgi:pimeloyl-ACP methyl ester carboxylesterase
MGWSERSNKPRTAAAIAADLHALLAAAKISGPYLLVGHSLGGLFARMYAYTYAQDVAALVLVDSSHEDQRQRLPEQYIKAEASMFQRAGAQMPLVRILTAIGVMAQFRSAYPVNEHMPAQEAATYQALAALDSSSLDTLLAEYRAIEESSNQVRAARNKTPLTIPLIVLSNGQPGPASANLTLSADVMEQQQRVWNELQGQLAALSPKGRRIIASQSGHYIQLDQPDLVITAIQQALAEVRK